MVMFCCVVTAEINALRRSLFYICSRERSGDFAKEAIFELRVETTQGKSHGGVYFLFKFCSWSLVSCRWHWVLSIILFHAFEVAELPVSNFCGGWLSFHPEFFMWEVGWFPHGWDPLVSLIPSLCQASSRHWWMWVNLVHLNSGTFAQKPHSSFSMGRTHWPFLWQGAFSSFKWFCAMPIISKEFLHISASFFYWSI